MQDIVIEQDDLSSVETVTKMQTELHKLSLDFVSLNDSFRNFANMLESQSFVTQRDQTALRRDQTAHVTQGDRAALVLQGDQAAQNVSQGDRAAYLLQGDHAVINCQEKFINCQIPPIHDKNDGDFNSNMGNFSNDLKTDQPPPTSSETKRNQSDNLIDFEISPNSYAETFTTPVSNKTGGNVVFNAEQTTGIRDL